MAEIIRIEDLLERQAGDVTKLEFEARKTYLEGYISITRRLDTLELELEELAYDIGPGSCCRDGQPGGGVSDGSGRIINRMAKMDRLREIIKREENALIRRRDDMTAAIDRMANGIQQEVLHYLYISGMDIRDIADKLHYSRRQVERIRDKGIKKIKLPPRSIARIKAELIIDHPEWADVAA